MSLNDASRQTQSNSEFRSRRPPFNPAFEAKTNMFEQMRGKTTKAMQYNSIVKEF
ncbi:hypothetical protein HYR65_03395 [Candidatus Azambacteria bacterium]|nr:hypothetical protein [Candidatus Azambacteria bacterium]